MPQDQIVLDLETQKAFDEVTGRNPAELKVSVVGVYFYATDLYQTFEEGDIGALEQKPSESGRVVGFNIRRFDFQVLQPYLKRIDLGKLPAFDLLEEVERLLGHRLSLQSIATATLNEGKSGSGLDAIRFFRNGEMEKLKKYCLDDVRLTKEIYEFGKKNGFLQYLSKDRSARLTVNVDWKDPPPPPNLSLF